MRILSALQTHTSPPGSECESEGIAEEKTRCERTGVKGAEYDATGNRSALSASNHSTQTSSVTCRYCKHISSATTYTLMRAHIPTAGQTIHRGRRLQELDQTLFHGVRKVHRKVVVLRQILQEEEPTRVAHVESVTGRESHLPRNAPAPSLLS